MIKYLQQPKFVILLMLLLIFFSVDMLAQVEDTPKEKCAFDGQHKKLLEDLTYKELRKLVRRRFFTKMLYLKF